ncbi:hypothetical protein E2C01_004511 [Portunus trituberculatus]|uniref:Uncharacterized protein n=1 Tax=Portunus trituberculatus TaxID=210409 RepID=A0A5B7CPY5_PORTR|nr:hypothetical protein [Portunus trituberculatus]
MRAVAKAFPGLYISDPIITKHINILSVTAAGGKRSSYTISYKLRVTNYAKEHHNRVAARAFRQPREKKNYVSGNSKKTKQRVQGKANMTFVAQPHIGQNLRMTLLFASMFSAV